MCDLGITLTFLLNKLDASISPEIKVKHFYPLLLSIEQKIKLLKQLFIKGYTKISYQIWCTLTLVRFT